MQRRIIQTTFALLFAVAATAQTQTLVPGNPPLTQGMIDGTIDFFQWALAGQFTPEQRREFTNQCISEWRKKSPTTMESVHQILKMRDLLMAAKPEQQNAAHGEVQKKLLEELQKTPNDETTRLLLKVYEQGRLNARNGGSLPNPQQAPVNSAGVRALVGKWRQSNSSSIGFVDRNTGSYAAPSGDWFDYDFHADGTYTGAALMQSSMYNCTMKVFGYSTGLYRIEGANLILTQKTHSLTSQDNCNKQYNYEKTLPLQTEAYQWRIEPGQYGLVLTLVYADGKRSLFHRVQ